jgi:ADP-heptose:LPS heptosyltransferase
MKVVALAFDTFGDQVLRQPMLSALLDAGHSVTLAMRPRYAELVPYLDPRLEVIECDAPAGTRLEGKAWPVLASALDALRRAQPDVVVDLPYTRTAASEWLLRNCDFARRIGFFPGNRTESLIDGLALPAGREPPLAFARTASLAVTVDEPLAEIEKNSVLLDAIAPGATAASVPRLVPREADRKAAARWLANAKLDIKRYVVVAPAGTQNVAIKRLPVARAVEAIERAWQTHGWAAVVVGIPGERDHLEAVVASAGNGAGPVVPWIGEHGSIGTLLALLEGAQAYIGADMGTMHFAAAVGMPVVALFGGGTFPRFRPAAQRWAGVAKRLACYGCEWNCMFGAPRCIEEVSRETWLAALDAVLGGGSPGWMFDPSGLDEQGARAAQPVVAKLRRELRLVDDDRTQRLALIERQDGELNALGERIVLIEADRERRLEALNAADRELANRTQETVALQSALAAAEGRLATAASFEQEAAKRLEVIVRQEAMLQSLQARTGAIEADRADRLAVIDRQKALIGSLQSRIDEIEADRADRLVVIDRQKALIGSLQSRIDEIEADRAARLAMIDELGHRLHAVEQGKADAEHREAELARQLDDARRSLANEAAGRASAAADAAELRTRLEYALASIARLRSFRGSLGALLDRVLGRKVDDDPARR